MAQVVCSPCHRKYATCRSNAKSLFASSRSSVATPPISVCHARRRGHFRCSTLLSRIFTTPTKKKLRLASCCRRPSFVSRSIPWSPVCSSFRFVRHLVFPSCWDTFDQTVDNTAHTHTHLPVSWGAIGDAITRQNCHRNRISRGGRPAMTSPTRGRPSLRTPRRGKTAPDPVPVRTCPAGQKRNASFL